MVEETPTEVGTMKKSEVKIGEEYAHRRGSYGPYSRVRVLEWVPKVRVKYWNRWRWLEKDEGRWACEVLEQAGYAGVSDRNYEPPLPDFGENVRALEGRWLHRTWAEQETIERRQKEAKERDSRETQRADHLARLWPGPGRAEGSRHGVTVSLSADEFERLLESMGA